jgi:hypothetical protein
MKNEPGKTRKVNEPYEIWVNGTTFEWRVLKKYQAPDKEAENPYARWFLATKGPGTYDSYEMGDGYARDIQQYGRKLTDEQMAEHLSKPENKWRQF